eukprot:COSAG02_NODE_1019_length_15171_cov_7.663482_10_plen_30_part_00
MILGGTDCYTHSYTDDQCYIGPFEAGCIL